MTLMHYLGASLVLLLITGLGIYSGTRVRSVGDFASGGGKAGTGIVTGALLGSLVGGASTIGTAQLAYSFGFSAWWFTLGGGIACLILGGVYARPMRASEVGTIPQMLHREYGKNASTTVSALTSLGTLMSIVSQVLSCVALVTSVSSLPAMAVLLLSVALMLAYVIFGGVWGAGLVGIAKTVLLSLAVGACGFLALNGQGGWSAFTAALPAEPYFNLTARGVAVDLGGGLSLVVGVLTTQAYIQAIISARTVRLARAGAYISAVVVPCIGAAGVVVGLYMRLNYPDISPASALPLFVLEKLPPLLAGMVLATLLVTIVGTAAGLALGVSAMFCVDIYKVYWNRTANDKALLRAYRLSLIAVLTAAGLISTGNLDSLILEWGFLSMGLRGAVAFGALSAALFFPGRVSSTYAIWSMLVGLFCVILGKPLFGDTIDPLFFGIAASLFVLWAGRIRRRG